MATKKSDVEVMDEVQNEQMGTVEPSVEVDEQAALEAKKAEQKAYMNQRVKVTIHSDPNDPSGGMLDVKLSCNGEMILVRRDVVVMMKRKHLCVLQDAVKRTYVLDANGSVVGEKLVPRFSYTVH